MIEIPACPHCGKEDAVYANERASGYAERQFFSDGTEELNIDGLHYVWSMTIRCCSCGKIRRDIVRTSEGIEVKNGN